MSGYYQMVNPLEAVAVKYTGKTVWKSISRKIRAGERVITKRQRLKLKQGAVLQVQAKDLSLTLVPTLSRGKQYRWWIPRDKLKVMGWGEATEALIKTTRREKMAANPVDQDLWDKYTRGEFYSKEGEDRIRRRLRELDEKIHRIVAKIVAGTDTDADGELHDRYTNEANHLSNILKIW